MERDGVSLETLLWRLLDRDPAIRLPAGEALHAILRGVPSVHTSRSDFLEYPDIGAQRRRFGEAIRRTFSAPGFRARDFVEGLIAYLIVTSDDWCRRVEESVSKDAARAEQFHRLFTRVERRPGEADSANKESALRLGRLIDAYVCGSGDSWQKHFASSESISFACGSARSVFDALGMELMVAPFALEQLLANRQERYMALRALERIGPPAIAFAPQLLEQMEQLSFSKPGTSLFDAAYALGAIGRGNIECVLTAMACLSHHEVAVRVAAATVLESMAPNVCGHEDEICARLIPMLDLTQCFASAIAALAAVGRDRAAVRERIIVLAGPRPARFDSKMERRDTPDDLTMFERGDAISAMSRFTDYPNECIPVLLDAIETFEEFDGDEMDQGPLGRIARTLSRFGPHAAPAVEQLTRHLGDEPDEMPVAILTALANIGPAAHTAVPALRKLRNMRYDDFTADIDISPISEVDDPIGWTIQRITGFPKSSDP
jgi:hypothetical protein